MAVFLAELNRQPHFYSSTFLFFRRAAAAEQVRRPSQKKKIREKKFRGPKIFFESAILVRVHHFFYGRTGATTEPEKKFRETNFRGEIVLESAIFLYGRTGATTEPEKKIREKNFRGEAPKMFSQSAIFCTARIPRNWVYLSGRPKLEFPC